MEKVTHALFEVIIESDVPELEDLRDAMREYEGSEVFSYYIGQTGFKTLWETMRRAIDFHRQILD